MFSQTWVSSIFYTRFILLRVTGRWCGGLESIPACIQWKAVDLGQVAIPSRGRDTVWQTKHTQTPNSSNLLIYAVLEESHSCATDSKPCLIARASDTSVLSLRLLASYPNAEGILYLYEKHQTLNYLQCKTICVNMRQSEQLHQAM